MKMVMTFSSARFHTYLLLLLLLSTIFIWLKIYCHNNKTHVHKFKHTLYRIHTIYYKNVHVPNIKTMSFGVLQLFEAICLHQDIMTHICNNHIKKRLMLEAFCRSLGLSHFHLDKEKVKRRGWKALAGFKPWGHMWFQTLRNTPQAVKEQTLI